MNFAHIQPGLPILAPRMVINLMTRVKATCVNGKHFTFLVSLVIYFRNSFLSTWLLQAICLFDM